MGWITAAAAGVGMAVDLAGNSTPTASAAEKAMLGRTNELLGTAQGLGSYEIDRMKDLANPEDERRSAVGKAVTGVNQALGGPPDVGAHRPGAKFVSDVVDQGSLRGKALSRVAQVADAQVDQKMLADRAQYLNLGLNKAKMALGQSANVVSGEIGNLREEGALRDARRGLITDALGSGAAWYTDDPSRPGVRT